jgi:hypothetical protein
MKKSSQPFVFFNHGNVRFFLLGIDDVAGQKQRS